MKLSPRQRRVAELTVQGFTDAEIARKLGISYSTVKTHQAVVRVALGVQKREHYETALKGAK